MKTWILRERYENCVYFVKNVGSCIIREIEEELYLS